MGKRVESLSTRSESTGHELSAVSSELKESREEAEDQLAAALLVSEKYRQLLLHQTETVDLISTENKELKTKLKLIEDGNTMEMSERRKLDETINSLHGVNSAVIMQSQTTASALREAQTLIEERTLEFTRLRPSLGCIAFSRVKTLCLLTTREFMVLLMSLQRPQT